MRYILYGAGGIGAGLGALLAQVDRDVVLIARGGHLEAIRLRGLRLLTPGGTKTLRLPAVRRPSDVPGGIGEGDVVVLAMKSQDTALALADLRRVAPGARVLCAQNGVANEPAAARTGFRVWGAMVWMPATFLNPGEVRLHGHPAPGAIDVGRWPEGADPIARKLSADLTAAGLRSEPREDVMAWKRAKLIANLSGVLRAITADPPRSLLLALQAEAEACYRAAGLGWVGLQDLRHRTRSLGSAPVGGQPREGGSAWQSLKRRRGTEADWLCGEIAVLGARHGVATPVNRAVGQLAVELALAGGRPRSLSAERVMAQVSAERATQSTGGSA